MADAELTGAEYADRTALEAAREGLSGGQFADMVELRRFVDLYAAAKPDELGAAAVSQVGTLVADVRAELGLGSTASPTLDAVIHHELTGLLLGHKAASADTSRWAVAHGADSVQMGSGQFSYGAEDIRLDGAGITFAFRRCYKNQGFARGPLGINWDHSYNQWLRFLDGGARIAHSTGMAQGAEYVRHGHYGAAGLSYWVPPPGDHRAIFDLSGYAAEIGLADSHGADYALRSPDGHVSLFERDPTNADQSLLRLSRMEDRFGNYLAFQYAAPAGLPGGRLAKVLVNSAHRFVSFSHDGEGRIVAIEDHLQRTWRYAYDDYGDLASVTLPPTPDHPTGLRESYAYSTASHSGALAHNLMQIRDHAGRVTLENEYGASPGQLAYNRVICQTDVTGARRLDYERIAPESAGGAEEEEIPAQQTMLVQRNGHVVHMIYNRFGNLLAEEEQIWQDGTRRRLVRHHRYNRDGATLGDLSAEGRITQRLFGRDTFLAEHGLQGESEAQLAQNPALTWRARQSFGNRMAEVRRAATVPYSSVQFPVAFPGLGEGALSAQDIITKYAYEIAFQHPLWVSSPEHTRSPWPDSAADATTANANFSRTLTRFSYRAGGRELAEIAYPATTRDGQPDVTGIAETFPAYDPRGRLLEHVDRAGTLTRRLYFPAAAAAREGYLEKVTHDPAEPVTNPLGLDLVTSYQVNQAGAVTAVVTPKGARANFELNALGQVTQASRILAPGVSYQTRYAYGESLQVVRIERDLADAAGAALPGAARVTRFVYDTRRNLTCETVGDATGADRLVTRYRYDDGDRLAATVLAAGNETRLSYDARRLPAAATRGYGTPEAATERFFHDGDGMLVEHVDARGQRTNYLRDGFGRVIELREHDEAGVLFRLQRFDHDKRGNVTVHRTFAPAGGGFDMLAHRSQRFDELGQRIEIRERRFAVPIPTSAAAVAAPGPEVPAAAARRTVLHYDRAGRLVAEEEIGWRVAPGGGKAAQPTVLVTQHAYNALGWPVSETDPCGNVTETCYDKHGQVARVDVREAVAASISPSGEEVFTTRFETDTLDRITAITDPLGNALAFAYDSLDRITESRDPLGNLTRWQHDIHGRCTARHEERTTTGQGGAPALAPAITRWRYDANGNCIETVDSLGRGIAQSFDALDRRVAVTYADGTSLTWTHDGNGNEVSLRDGRGLRRVMRYDALERLIETRVDVSAMVAGVRVAAPSVEAFDYDALGHLRRARNDWCDLRFDRDSLGYVWRERVAFTGLAATFILEREIDDFGFAARLTYPGGRKIIRSPDPLQRLVAIDEAGAGQSYPGAAGLPAQRPLLTRSFRGLRAGTARFGNGTEVVQSDDAAGRPWRRAHFGPGSQVLLELTALYDGAGNLRLAGETAPGQAHVEAHWYDSQAHLSRSAPRPGLPPLPAAALRPHGAVPPEAQAPAGQADIDAALGPAVPPVGAAGFDYDLVGNRVFETGPAGPLVSVVNANNQCTRHGARLIDYDTAGLVAAVNDAAGTVSFAHDHQGRLTAADAATPLLRLHRDPLGRPLWANSGGSERFLLHDGDRLIEEWQRPAGASATPALAAQFVHDDASDVCFHAALNGQDYWLHTDLVGSIRLLTDAAGAVAARYAFTVFGAWHGPGPMPALAVPFGFAGRRYEAALRLYDFGARAYDPASGRFLQRDPAALETDPTRTAAVPVAGPLGSSAGSVELDGRVLAAPATATSDYGYARNNPLRYGDASGRDETELIARLARSRAFALIMQTIASLGAGKPVGPGAPKVPPPRVLTVESGKGKPVPEPKPPAGGSGAPPEPPPRPPRETGPRSQEPRRVPQTRARGGPTRGSPGYATPEMIRGIGLALVHGWVINNYIKLFRAGLGFDLEQRQQWSDVFRMSKEQVRELQAQRRQQELQKAQQDYESHVSEVAKQRGVSVAEQKETFRREQERERTSIKPYPTISTN